MRRTTWSALTAGVLAASVFPMHAVADEMDPMPMKDAAPAGGAAPMDRGMAEKMIASLPERPRLAALQMMGKYGPPQEGTPEKLIWRNPGPYKRIVVTRQEDPHDFPLPHMDYLQHTIAYRVPADKVDELTKYDGSLTVDRTVGEMSARCDLEGHNILTLNLANDIATGKASPEEARKSFGENVALDTAGKNPPYVAALRFEPAKASEAADPDQPVIPGSPRRAKADGGAAGGEKARDAEVLGYVVAVDMNEVLAAAEAQKKKISPDVMAYAKMLQEEHAQNLMKTMQVGQQAGAPPLLTPAVDKLRVKGAGELATLVPLDGEAFGKAYLQAMVKGHQEALDLLDQELKAAGNDAVKTHLTETRGHVAAHLDKAKMLQGGGSQ